MEKLYETEIFDSIPEAKFHKYVIEDYYAFTGLLLDEVNPWGGILKSYPGVLRDWELWKEIFEYAYVTQEKEDTYLTMAYEISTKKPFKIKNNAIAFIVMMHESVRRNLGLDRHPEEFARLIENSSLGELSLEEFKNCAKTLMYQDFGLSKG